MTASDSSLTRSLSVTDRLRDILLQGGYAPGERLQEVQLAEKMQVSRTPVREALRVLSLEGLLLYEPNKGYRMQRFSRDYILQAFRVRMALEGLAARLAAERGLNSLTRGPLLQAVAQGDVLLAAVTVSDELKPEWRDAWREMNMAFHAAIQAHAENDVLLRASVAASRVPMVCNSASRWYGLQDFIRSHGEHHRIFEAIDQQQPDRADFLMQEHIYQAAQLVGRHYLGPE